MTLPPIPPHRPVLIAGPTASGKSALALRIAEAAGGVIINADALQVFSDWRVLTARPSAAEEARVPHRLYGHVPGTQPYSVGAWLRDIDPLLDNGDRPIIVGGTGLYFRALTEGLADIPATDLATRTLSEAFLADQGLAAMVAALDAPSRAGLDIANPRRVQRAWEVLHMTGRGIAAWQAETPPPRLSLAAATAIVVDLPVAVLNARIAARFAAMIAEGALDEARANAPTWSPNQPSAKAIGAAELVAHVRGEMSLDAAREQATIATRQFAKRQRTWFRSRMPDWHRYTPPLGPT